MNISIIIPAYNESIRISKTIRNISNYLEKNNFNSEIIVVNDGSIDDTSIILKNLSLEIKKLKIINQKENNGKGYAVKVGMLEACGEFCLYMDADESVSIENLKPFLKELQNGQYGFVSGSIATNESKVKDSSGSHRRFFGYLSRFLVRTLLSLSVKDTQRGFKLFHKDIVIDIFERLTIKRFGFDIEIFVLAESLNIKHKEISVHWDNPKGSKVTLFSYLQTFKDLLKIFYNKTFNVYKKPIKNINSQGIDFI